MMADKIRMYYEGVYSQQGAKKDLKKVFQEQLYDESIWYRLNVKQKC